MAGTLNDLLQVKILVLGDQGVGKRSLVKSLCEVGKKDPTRRLNENVAPEPIMRGCQVSFRVHCVNGQNVVVAFWILEPGAQYESSRDFWLRCADYDGVLLVYDLFSKTSRLNIRRVWLPLLIHFEAAFESEEAHQTVVSRMAYSDVIARERRSLSRRNSMNAPVSPQMERALNHMLSFSYDKFCELMRSVLHKVLDVCRVLFSYMLSSEDLLSVAEERRLVQQLLKPGALLGTNQDIYKTYDRHHVHPIEHQKRGFSHIYVDAHNSHDNGKLVAFLNGIIEQRLHFK